MRESTLISFAIERQFLSPPVCGLLFSVPPWWCILYMLWKRSHPQNLGNRNLIVLKIHQIPQNSSNFKIIYMEGKNIFRAGFIYILYGHVKQQWWRRRWEGHFRTFLWGLCKMQTGWRRMADGGWRMADGGWRMADDKMRMTKCGWKNADDKMRMEKCGWQKN